MSITSALPRVAIIVLNWNGGATTLECLKSLAGLRYPDVRQIVVDNGSTDGSPAAVRTAFPSVELVETGRNLGYSGGNNVGIRAALLDAETKYLLVLNNDTIVEPSLLDELVNANRRATTTEVLTPKIYYANRPKTFWFAGGLWDETGFDFFHRGDGDDDRGQFDEAISMDYASGCALFATREVFERVGLLDERFFLTYEETDWCYRARAAGYRCRLIPRAIIWHKVSFSFGSAQAPHIAYFSYRNRLLWGEKHLSLWGRLRMLTVVLWEIALPSLRAFPNRRIPLTKRLYWLARNHELVRGFYYSTPVYKASLEGVRDYFLRRFGDPSVSRKARE